MKVNVHTCRNISHPIPVIAWLIMLFQGMLPWRKDSWSHICMSLSDNTGGTLHFFESSFGGVRRVSPKKYLKNYKIIDSYEIDEVNFLDFIDWFEDYEFRKYDYLQLLGIAIKVIGKNKFNRIGGDLKRLTCNELVIAYLVDNKGLGIIDSDDFDLISTIDIVKGA